MPTLYDVKDDPRKWPEKVYRGSFGTNARLKIEWACRRKRKRAVFRPA